MCQGADDPHQVKMIYLIFYEQKEAIFGYWTVNCC